MSKNKTKLTIQSFHQMASLISVKLSNTNSLLWKSQVFPVIRSAQLMNHLEEEAPVMNITRNGKEETNPDYEVWLNNDRLLTNWLLGTMNEEALSLVVRCDTTSQIWRINPSLVQVAQEEPAFAKSSQESIRVQVVAQEELDPTESSQEPIGVPPPSHNATSASTHPMMTRTRIDIREPKTIKKALQLPQWLRAMQEELVALYKNNTWTLVPPPSTNTNIVGSKWVFKTKLNSDGSVDRFKARLMARRFSQVPGVTLFSGGIFLSQAKYAKDILTRATMLETSIIATPMEVKEPHTPRDEDLVDAQEYRKIVGALQHLAITKVDLYWAGCTITGRSTTRFCIFLGANCISWSSKKQSTIARSTTEAEYRALASTTAELVWITYLLRDIGISLLNPPQVFSNNISALHMFINPMFHARTKHIELDYHFVREKVTLGSLVMRYISSIDQIADIFTKPLPRTQF
ncbi:hypothetical protein SLEP1_g31573 [Rubroshorea leprosula]|uniref:Reverse transcriptase Ty1/copia-type domain-containing protein n=1 Tax=Rubroshorea leprosula TaxID=152421 RepID=A0AAV5KAY0_9ROSI|nr:hypothetical protein SLEP1_g31573 [Rubroshorea leprosula]